MANNKGLRTRKRDCIVILLIVWFSIATLVFLYGLALWFYPSIKLAD